MQTRNNLKEFAVVDSQSLPWIPSPPADVERRMFERNGHEVARATSPVREV